METSGKPENEKYLILAQELMRRIYADMTADEIHAWLLAQVQKVATQGNENAALLWPDSFPYYDALLDKRETLSRLPPDQRGELFWAWDTWNRMIDPLEPGLLAVISAGDGMGKTIYAEVQAEAWAKAGKQVAFVHFELNRAIMLDRRAARHTGINRRELKAGNYTQTTRRAWHDARGRLMNWKGGITYWHTPGWSMEQVTQQMETEITGGRCDVVIIDYLEKAQSSTRQQKLFGTNSWQREADDVERIKTFAERTETPIIVLAQMNKSGKATGISSLDRTAIRGAGEKTEKANIVVLLNRERVEGGYAPLVDVRVDKNTLGPTGNFQQFLDGEHFRVFDVTPGL